MKQHEFPVIFVRLDGTPAPGLPFLRQLHWIITADPGSDKSVAQIMDAARGGGALTSDLWRHTAPYRGLAAMEENDSDYFTAGICSDQSFSRAGAVSSFDSSGAGASSAGALLADKKLRLLSISGAKWSQARSIFR